MAHIFLILCLRLMGLIVIAIGGAMALFGPHALGAFFAGLAGLAAPLGLEHANSDSELRFYSVFFVAYGVAVYYVAQNFEAQHRWLPVLAGLFVLGGLARLLSWVTLGAPHPLFIFLCALELGVPILLITLYAISRRAHG